MNADGTGRVLVTGSLAGAAFGLPAWSPDGRRLAFVARGFVGVVGRDGSGLRRLPAPGVTGSLEWSPDGRRILVSGGAMNAPDVGGVHLLDVASGRSTMVSPFGTGATWSPDGMRIAFAGGGECKDRLGIYRATPDGRRERLTHDCRVLGTAGPDVLAGTQLADLLLGVAGDDRLRAVDGNYMGDDLSGGTGADVLEGGALSNVLEGGPGADRLDGMPGPDTLRGGLGRDVLAGSGGRDVLFAEDGERDTVSCGTNSPSGGRELDTAFLDARDRVAADCELVYRGGRANLRRGRTAFGITVRTDSRRPAIRRTLRCNPAGGTLPHPARACRLLGTMRGPLAPVAPGRLCAATPQSLVRAQIEGSFAGTPVLVSFGRGSSCEVERWNRHRFLLEPR